jgi:hypothetical protein
MLRLGGHPCFEFPNCFSQCGQLDVGVTVVDVITDGMPHKHLADVLDHSALHQPAVEGVAQVVKAEIPDSRAADSGLPCGLDVAHWLAVACEEQALLLAFCEKELVNPVGEGNFSPFAAGGFRLGDGENSTVEIDMLPELVEQLAPPHTGIKRRDDELTEMWSGCGQESPFVIEPQDRSGFAAFLDKAKTAERV